MILLTLTNQFSNHLVVILYKLQNHVEFHWGDAFMNPLEMGRDQ